MANQFHKKLKRILLLGTLMPIIFFVLIFFYKYNEMNIDTLKEQFEVDEIVFEKSFNQKLEGLEEDLKSKLNLLNKQKFRSEGFNNKFYAMLFNSEEVVNYYHLKGLEIIHSSDSSNPELNEKLSLLNESMKNGLWVNKLDSKDEPFLYIGYTDLELNETLVLEVQSELLFKNYANNKIDNNYFEIYYKQKLIYINHNINMKFPEEEDGLYRGENKTSYLFSSRRLNFNSMHYIYISDISREINFVNDALKWFALVMFVYLILAFILLLKSSKVLLKPLDVLVSRVSSVADGKPLGIQEYKLDSEFKAIMNKFDDLIKTSAENMASILKQSEVIKEKNESILDLNEALELSAAQIEFSTKEWMIYEKQSKILVDNIKDLMWVLDTKGRIIYINGFVKEKLGYDSQELLGVSLETLLKESIETEEFLENLFREDIDAVDTIFINKQGEDEEIYVTSTKRIYVNGHLTKIQGVSRDITEERYIQKQLLQKNEISNTLNEISEILTKPEKLEVLLHQIVSRIEKLLEPYVCTIRLIDDEGRLELKAGIGAFYALVQEKYLDIDTDISGRAIKESKIIIVSKQDSSYYDNYHEISKIIEKSKEIIFMPLEYNDHVIGVMSIGLKESISDSQLKILKVFTNQASAAIEKARMYDELEKSYLNIIKALASTVEAKDSYTEDHSIRVSQYTRMIAETIGLSDEEVGYMDIAGLLHDIGKIGVSDLTLTKKGKLTDQEFLEIKKHPINGERIVSEMKLHQYIIDGVFLHHKRFDLKGYPDIDIDYLPLSARIIGVADAFDAMTSDRSYQNARSFEMAYQELLDHRGTQFCPVIVEAMGEVIKRLQV